jgi:hypothetical protein
MIEILRNSASISKGKAHFVAFMNVLHFKDISKMNSMLLVASTLVMARKRRR